MHFICGRVICFILLAILIFNLSNNICSSDKLQNIELSQTKTAELTGAVS
ncbi:MAG: hypothetical protein WCK67_04750 [bacterium]